MHERHIVDGAASAMYFLWAANMDGVSHTHKMGQEKLREQPSAGDEAAMGEGDIGEHQRKGGGRWAVDGGGCCVCVFSYLAGTWLSGSMPVDERQSTAATRYHVCIQPASQRRGEEGEGESEREIGGE